MTTLQALSPLVLTIFGIILLIGGFFTKDVIPTIIGATFILSSDLIDIKHKLG